jgi:hypothetical protein
LTAIICSATCWPSSSSFLPISGAPEALPPPSSSSRPIVMRPTRPSALSPLSAWNWRTTASVSLPKMPSGEPVAIETGIW